MHFLLPTEAASAAKVSTIVCIAVVYVFMRRSDGVEVERGDGQMLCSF